MCVLPYLLVQSLPKLLVHVVQLGAIPENVVLNIVVQLSRCHVAIVPEYLFDQALSNCEQRKAFE